MCLTSNTTIREQNNRKRKVLHLGEMLNLVLITRKPHITAIMAKATQEE